MTTHLHQFTTMCECPGCLAADRGNSGDRDSQMQTVISRGLRHAHRSPTCSARVLRNVRVHLCSTVQHTRCSRAYSSIPSSGDRDKTAVGVSSSHLKQSEIYNNWFQVFSPTAAAVFIATGAGLFYYFNSEKESLKKKKGCVVNLVSVPQVTHNQVQRKSSWPRPTEDLKSVARSRYSLTKIRPSLRKICWGNGL